MADVSGPRRHESHVEGRTMERMDERQEVQEQRWRTGREDEDATRRRGAKERREQRTDGACLAGRDALVRHQDAGDRRNGVHRRRTRCRGGGCKAEGKRRDVAG